MGPGVGGSQCPCGFLYQQTGGRDLTHRLLQSQRVHPTKCVLTQQGKGNSQPQSPHRLVRFCRSTPIMRKQDLLLAPLGEAFLLFIPAVAGWLTHQPLIFASLGPTAYELIETPHRPSARPYSVFFGHLTGVGAGYFALVVTGAWWAARVSAGGVPLARMEAALLATGLTVLVTLLLHASQPAALSTTLLISLGILQQPKDAAVIMSGIILMILFGEPLRIWRLKRQQQTQDRQT